MNEETKFDLLWLAGSLCIAFLGVHILEISSGGNGILFGIGFFLFFIGITSICAVIGL